MGKGTLPWESRPIGAGEGPPRPRYAELLLRHGSPLVPLFVPCAIARPHCSTLVQIALLWRVNELVQSGSAIG